jgi:hypothetical protein
MYVLLMESCLSIFYLLCLSFIIVWLFFSPAHRASSSNIIQNNMSLSESSSQIWYNFEIGEEIRFPFSGGSE